MVRLLKRKRKQQTQEAPERQAPKSKKLNNEHYACNWKEKFTVGDTVKREDTRTLHAFVNDNYTFSLYAHIVAFHRDI
jgi:hypothetical protein